MPLVSSRYTRTHWTPILASECIRQPLISNRCTKMSCTFTVTFWLCLSGYAQTRQLAYFGGAAKSESWVNFNIRIFWNLKASLGNYIRITPTKSPSFCTTTFNAGLTSLTFPLPKSHCVCYWSRRMLTIKQPDYSAKNTTVCDIGILLLPHVSVFL
jgi:hypothetical protein